MFTLNVVWYLFLAGAGSGLVFVAFVIDSALRQLQTLVFLRYKSLIAPSLIVGFLLTAFAGVLLAIDVGRPDRLLMLLIHPAVSIVSLGFWTILVFQFSVLLQLFVRVFFHPILPKWLHILIRWLSAISALVIMVYTGVLFQNLQTVSFWNTWLLPVLFVLSSLSAGIALMLLLDFFGCTRGQISTQRAGINWLSFSHSVVLICELIALTAYALLMLGGSDETFAAVQVLLFGSLALPFWLLAVLAGILIPLLLENMRGHRRTRFLLILSGILVLSGAFALRYCLLQVGIHPDIKPFFLL